MSRLAVLFVAAIYAGQMQAQTVNLLQPFPYQASEVDVRQFVSDIAKRTGVPGRMHENVHGAVTVGASDATLRDVLDDAVSQVAAVWWFDGVVLHVEPSADLTTVLIDAQGLSLARISSELERLNMSDTRFPLLTSQDGAILRVSGPKGYVEQVVLLITTLADLRRNRSSRDTELGLYVPHVYYGRSLN